MDYCPLGKEARLVRKARQFRHGGCTQLRRDTRAMQLHRALMDAEISGDLFVQASANYMAENFALTLGQLLESRAYLASSRALLAFARIARKRALDRMEQYQLSARSWLENPPRLRASHARSSECRPGR